MNNTEREARRLVSDSSSWSQRSIAHKAYRQMALTPEEEIPKHFSDKKRKKKHVHKWGEWIREGEITRTSWIRGKSGHYKKGQRYIIVKWVRTCKKCGYRGKGESHISLDWATNTGYKATP